MTCLRMLALATAVAFFSAPAIARAEMPATFAAIDAAAVPVGTAIDAPAAAPADETTPAGELIVPAQGPDELDLLSQRDAAANDLENFEGGEPVIIIGGSVLAAILVVLLLVLLLRKTDDGDGKTVVITD